MEKVAIFWFRRDLRLEDNAGLYHALRSGFSVLPIFIFDTDILEGLPRKDARVEFIHQNLAHLQASLMKMGNSLRIYKGKPLLVWKEICATYSVQSVYANHDYEPYALRRDEELKQVLLQQGISFHTYKDQVIFEKSEILNLSEKPYTVFTPYYKNWRAKLNDFYLKSYPTTAYFSRFYHTQPYPFPSLSEIGFEPSGIEFPSQIPSDKVLQTYHEKRNFPSVIGTTRIGVHLRFGTISIRDLARKAIETNEIYLKELVWREFYMQILWHFPKVVTQSFKPEYDNIVWINNESDFEKWKTGKTGFPLVDAGMRELNATGYMHNRVRMLVASFLTKHLLIDWRWGEAYFAGKLLDFELASNNGGWQWAASCGCDAAPYFRIFSPDLQLEKFDKNLVYVRKWVPEWGTPLYPKPMVVHGAARERALRVYSDAVKQI